ncbi:MAG: hypothetical protein MZV65_29495 [Chromatiales bacterium]|nr:hypothetical protein [Chromatiales bacterium]
MTQSIRDKSAADRPRSGAQGLSRADASGLIKLDAMENPYALPERAARTRWLRAAARRCAINRYPGPGGACVAAELLARARRAGRHGAAARQRLRRADPDHLDERRRARCGGAGARRRPS